MQSQWCWQEPYPCGTWWYNDIFFVSPQTGWMAGADGLIISTTDGGNTWNKQESWTFEDLNGIYFTDSLYGWMFGDHGVILHTEDGGSNWEMHYYPNMYTLYDGWFFDQQEGWICGANTLMLHTIDGGDTWIKVQNGLEINLELVNITFLSETNGWVGGTRG